MSSTQTQAPTGTTTPTTEESPSPPSATNSRAPTDTTTKYASGSQGRLGETTTRAPTSLDPEYSYQKNAGLNTTSTPSQNPRDRSLPHSSPLSLHQPRTHLGFPHSNSQKPVLAPQPHHSVSDKASRTRARKPLQRLFRPYPKPTPHLHPYPRLRLRNPYYAIKSTFDTSTNPTLRRQFKPTFRRHHNQLLHHTASINIPRWIPNRSCRLLPPSPPALQRSPPMLTGSYRTLLLLTFQL